MKRKTLLTLLFLSSLAHAGAIRITLSSAAPPTATGTNFAFEFQMSNGDGVNLNNSVSISNFYSENLLIGSSIGTGSFSGDLLSTLTLQDDDTVAAPPFLTSHFTEFILTVPTDPFTIAFDAVYTELGTGTPSPDLFSFWMWETAPGFQSVNTNPLEDGSLVAIPLQLNPGGIVIQFADQGYAASFAEIPEPGTFALSGLALAAIAANSVRRQKWVTAQKLPLSPTPSTTYNPVTLSTH